MPEKLYRPAPDWREAKCLRFPPTRDEDPWYDDQEEAIQVCNGDVDGVICPVRQYCLEYALINNLAHGIFGGTFEHDRRRLRREARGMFPGPWKSVWPKAIEGGWWKWQEPTDPELYDAELDLEEAEEEYDPEDI